MPRYIAIDGPVASGKSAVGSRVARRLGYRFIDTGVMYRALTWLTLERGIDLHDEEALSRLAEGVSITIEAASPGATDASRVLVDGVDMTERLRSTEVGEAVSLVSRVPAVREAMVAMQRDLAGQGDVVMVGRDIGTVVLPDAPLKVYLDASPEERVRRRYEELLSMGREASPQQVRDELALRDAIDSERAVSPLRPAADAVIIHTDHLSLDEVVERILELVPCRS
ncbi:MAG: cytidylate kinase [Chloroflexi bacterium RBG_16_68_14]|nr:MAG: cytidylate kinase [Chloroflexi bacterium RBG_16_68_14]